MPKTVMASNIETNLNKVTELNESVTDEQYPSAKAVYDKIVEFDNTIGNINSILAILVEGSAE